MTFPPRNTDTPFIAVDVQKKCPNDAAGSRSEHPMESFAKL